MNAKVRDAQVRKVPYALVVGDREEEGAAAALRAHGENLGALPVVDIVERLRTERDTKALAP
jgi:threonyl-tRNA synthetase